MRDGCDSGRFSVAPLGEPTSLPQTSAANPSAAGAPSMLDSSEATVPLRARKVAGARGPANAFSSLRAERGRSVDRRPLPYPRPITLFRVPTQPSNEIYATDPLLGWGELAAGGLEVIDVEGFHGQPMFREPYRARVGLKAPRAHARGAGLDWRKLDHRRRRAPVAPRRRSANRRLNFLYCQPSSAREWRNGRRAGLRILAELAADWAGMGVVRISQSFSVPSRSRDCAHSTRRRR